ncbi:hypothetical protein GCM10009610_30360 [Pseudonocardia xinjiangensis]
MLDDEGGAFADPWVDDELSGLALQLAQDGIDRDRHSRYDRLDVRVHQGGQLVAIGAAKRPYLSDGHHGSPVHDVWEEAATGAVRPSG